MNFRAFGLALACVAPLLAGAEGGNCTRMVDETDDDAPDPNSPAQPFLDEFTSGLTYWRLTAPIPAQQMAQGNPLPSMEVGSASMLPTGGLTVRKFDASGGLVIEADVFWQAPSVSTTAIPQWWIGLSDEDDPTGASGLAAGVWVDPSNNIHYLVSGAILGSGAAPAPGAWHHFSTTIRPDRVVEFRVDGALVLTGGQLGAGYLVKPIEACGIGYPERPKFDNVAAHLP